MKISDIKNLAKANLLGSYRQPIIATAMYLLIPTAIMSLFDTSTGKSTIILIIAAAIVMIFQSMLSAGMCAAMLSMARKKTCSWRMLFFPFSHSDKFFGLALINMLISYLPLAPSFILFFVKYSEKSLDTPSVILILILMIAGFSVSFYLSVALSLMFFVMLDHTDLALTECIRKSVALMQGNMVKMLLLQLSFIGWFILAILSLGIGYLWVLPWFYETLACFYRDTIKEHDVRVTISFEGKQAQSTPTHDWGVVTDDTVLSTELPVTEVSDATAGEAETANAQQMTEEVTATQDTDTVNEPQNATEDSDNTSDTIQKINDNWFFED